MKRLFLFTLEIVTAFALIVPAARAHDLPHVFQDYPKSPPTTDPGPEAALLRVRIIDAATREVVPATVSVNHGQQEPDVQPLRKFGLRFAANRQKGPIRSRPISFYFYTAGTFEVRVPPGGTLIEVCKGYEYRPVEFTFAAAKNQRAEVEIALERSIDMSVRPTISIIAISTSASR